ncbi:MAG: glycosyltransferase N-terminal domain-containing protein [Rhodobacter sp.]|nr:glycosyltransferase N-terminal domain-containing protein [Rhodobacter sp.]
MFLYRAILTLFAPVIFGALLLRVLRGAESPGDLRQRLGQSPQARPGALWLHGASNGELTSAKPLVDAICAAFPERPIIVTANTVTGRTLAETWRLPNVTAQLAPLDFRWALARFRAAWRPAALIVLENEFWPNRIDSASEPVHVVGARISEKSRRMWSRFPRLARHLLGRIHRLSPQDPASAERFLALGLPGVHLGPTATLKSAVTLAPPDPAQLDALAPVFHRADTLLAASTHDGEEQALIDAFVAARQSRQALKLILAPRHPARAPEIAAPIRNTGLPWAQRSTCTTPAAGTVVYLADTLGEMALWYALSGVTFVGGSLVPLGGHTPFEPVQARSAVLHGPHTGNFSEAYAALASDGSAISVDGSGALTDALLSLPEAEKQLALADRAARTLAKFDLGQKVIDDTVELLRQHLGSGPGQ